MIFCIEILGESAFHPFLIQSGWSGRDYLFKYNRLTQSHMRAYRRVEDYRAERVDMHKSANIWPLLANWLPEELVEAQVFTEPKGDEAEVSPKKRGAKVIAKEGGVAVASASTLNDNSSVCH